MPPGPFLFYGTVVAQFVFLFLSREIFRETLTEMDVNTVKVIVKANRQQLYMVYTIIDYRNDVKIFPGKWFHCKVFSILTSFLWLMRAQTMEYCCQFVKPTNSGNLARLGSISPHDKDVLKNIHINAIKHV